MGRVGLPNIPFKLIYRRTPKTTFIGKSINVVPISGLLELEVEVLVLALLLLVVVVAAAAGVEVFTGVAPAAVTGVAGGGLLFVAEEASTLAVTTARRITMVVAAL